MTTKTKAEEAAEKYFDWQANSDNFCPLRAFRAGRQHFIEHELRGLLEEVQRHGFDYGVLAADTHATAADSEDYWKGSGISWRGFIDVLIERARKS